MKKLVLFIMMVASVFRAEAYHWTPNSGPYANTMTVIGIIEVDGEERNVPNLEIGAFCGDECRGREMPMHIADQDRYMVFLTLYGNDGDTLRFRLYDADLGEELVLNSLSEMTFAENAILGSVGSPYVFGFETVTYQIEAEVNPEAAGSVIGTGIYQHGSMATLTATANEGYQFLNWTLDGEVVSTDATYSFEVIEAASYVANFELNNVTQTSTFVQGWNWWSSYVELDGANSLQGLEGGLGTSGMMIKSQNAGYASYLEGFGWYGSLTTLNNENTYQVRVSEACTVAMTGTMAQPADHPITLVTGWNWIGYPVSVSMTISEALSGITPQNGDMLKSQNNGYASYLEGFGWYGSLSTLQPGMGLMYKSNSSQSVTFTFPTVIEQGQP